MKRWQTLVTDERGVAIVMALILLVALTTLVLAFLSVSAFEPQISANLASTSQARYVADGGLEWGFNQLALGISNWDLLLQQNGGALSNGNMTIPGSTGPLPPAFGQFSVTIRNDIQAGDQLMTGVPVDTGTATTDTNHRVIMTSVGTIGGVTRTITTAVKGVLVPPGLDAALSFPGLQADTRFNGASFEIIGTDTNMDGTAGPGRPVYGITVNESDPVNGNAPTGTEAGVEGSLTAGQLKNVVGLDETDPGDTTSGVDTIEALDPAAPDTLTAEQVQYLVDIARDQADISLTGPYSASTLGSTCGGPDTDPPTCWGTASDPKIIYVNTSVPLDTQLTALSISGGSTGTGILVVENGNIDITGNFRWNGLIINTGTNVGIRYNGGGFQEVYGGVIINETNPNPPATNEALVSGNAKIRYSTQALSILNNRLQRKFLVLYSWREQ